jgi:hypothetical protein
MDWGDSLWIANLKAHGDFAAVAQNTPSLYHSANGKETTTRQECKTASRRSRLPSGTLSGASFANAQVPLGKQDLLLRIAISLPQLLDRLEDGGDLGVGHVFVHIDTAHAC